MPSIAPTRRIFSTSAVQALPTRRAHIWLQSTRFPARMCIQPHGFSRLSGRYPCWRTPGIFREPSAGIRLEFLERVATGRFKGVSQSLRGRPDSKISLGLNSLPPVLKGWRDGMRKSRPQCGSKMKTRRPTSTLVVRGYAFALASTMKFAHVSRSRGTSSTKHFEHALNSTALRRMLSVSTPQTGRRWKLNSTRALRLAVDRGAPDTRIVRMVRSSLWWWPSRPSSSVLRWDGSISVGHLQAMHRLIHVPPSDPFPSAPPVLLAGISTGYLLPGFRRWSAG